MSRTITKVTKPATTTKPKKPTNKTTTMPGFNSVTVSEYQARVYELLLQVPAGRITSYAAMAKALNSSPRAIGGAMRNNPFAPKVPCHRCIASTGVSFTLPKILQYFVDVSLMRGIQYIGGFKGDWEKAPSGINCEKKLELLQSEGVKFNKDGMLMDKSQWWSDFKV